jgi:DHA1 family inner membrane transport protein
MIVWGAATFAVVPPLQMRVMRVAHEAPGLSSSVNIGAFNLGNALGAAAGGAVISGGLGYAFVPVMGAIIAGLALLLVWFSGRAQPEEALPASNHRLGRAKTAAGETLLRLSFMPPGWPQQTSS